MPSRLAPSLSMSGSMTPYPHSRYRSDTMNNGQRLNQVADRYRSLGFKVVIHPQPDQLPPFAKDFQVELVATKEDGSALVVAKNSPSELEGDPNVQRYADLTNGQAGWRLDLLVLGPDTPPVLV